MANERRRAENLESQFQQLLEELKVQDEQIESLFASAGVSRDELPEVHPKAVAHALEAFDGTVGDQRRRLLSGRERKQLTGLVVRA
jgi:hypothetical protein